MRRFISTTLVAASLVAVTAVGAVAQSEPAAEQAIVPAGLNAGKVDGRHAVGHRASRKKRAGNLVATDKQGFLPSNIVKFAWRLILGNPAAFRDGKISWGEVPGKPGGFADGVDAVGVTGIKITKVGFASVKVAAVTFAQAVATCPSGSKVVGGGFAVDPKPLDVYASARHSLEKWLVREQSTTGVDGTLWPFAYCLSTQPAGAISTAGTGR